MFIVALYLPWCRYLYAQVGVQSQLYADILECVSRDPDVVGTLSFLTFIVFHCYFLCCGQS